VDIEKGYEVSFCDEENDVKLTVVMAAHVFKWSKTYQIVYFKWMDYMYPNYIIIKLL
jgi:hypothetical protein